MAAAAGCITYDEEWASPVAPHRMFRALYEDAHNMMPKILPHFIKSVEFVSGDGSPGSIQLMKFADGSPMKFIKNRWDSIDKEHFEIKYTVIEGDEFGEIDHICHQVKFEAAPSTTTGSIEGCICKIKCTYYPKIGAVLNEEKIKAGMEGHLALNKIIENYLVENPDVCA